MTIFETFKSNCTLPPQGVNFVSSPGVRGTLDIVWTSISILLLCTYSILHQNIPIQSSPRQKVSGQFFQPKKWRFFFRFLHKAGWVVLNLVAPELPFAKAWCDFRSARDIHKSLEKAAEGDHVEWSLKHTHVANMGGFMIKFNIPASNEIESTPGPSAVEKDKQATVQISQGQFDTNNKREEGETTSPRRKLHSRWLGCSGCQQSDVEAGDHSAASSPATSPTEPNHISNVKNYPSIYKLLADVDAQQSLGKFGETVEDWSNWIGSIDWKVDQQNLEMVKKALGSVEEYLKKDKTGKQKKHFDSTWPSWYRNLRALLGNVWVLDARQLLLARELGIIDSLPRVTKDDLNDRNTGDIPVMLVALFQIGWFVLQLIVRLCQWKSTSQLEILSLSFAGITAVTYVLLWDKPKDMTCSIVTEARKYPESSDNLIHLALVGPIALSPKRLTSAALIKRKLDQDTPSLRGAIIRLQYSLTAPIRYANTLCVSNFNIHLDGDLESAGSSSITSFMAMCSVALIGFGALHLIAWDFAFPTLVECRLWRASTIVTISAPCYAILIHLYTQYGSKGDFVSWMRFGKLMQGTPKALTYLGLAIYFFLARIFILVEALRSLAFLPPDGFETSWPSNLPHVV